MYMVAVRKHSPFKLLNTKIQDINMQAQYLDEYNQYSDCLLLASNLKGTRVLIELDGERGWCSSHLVEENWSEL
jgi:hypothetical protein